MTVTPDSIALALGQPEPDATTAEQWQMWINDAILLIEARAELLHRPIHQISEAPFDYAVREAVTAHIKHPDDSTQVTVSVDDATTSRSYSTSQGRVTIAPEHWALLGLQDTTGAFTIDTTTATHQDPVKAFLTATDSVW